MFFHPAGSPLRQHIVDFSQQQLTASPSSHFTHSAIKVLAILDEGISLNVQSTLQDGLWREAVDHETGKRYRYHVETKKTQWIDDNDSTRQQHSQLQHSRFPSTMERPMGLEGPTPQGQKQSLFQGGTLPQQHQSESDPMASREQPRHQPSTQLALPPGLTQGPDSMWNEAVDHETGQTYYW